MRWPWRWPPMRCCRPASSAVSAPGLRRRPDSTQLRKAALRGLGFRGRRGGETVPAMTKLTLDDLTFIGSGLKRPECVACTAAGAIWVSHAPGDGAGGVARLDAAGRLHPLPA